MTKPSVTDHLTSKEKQGAVDAALAGGMEPIEVFKAVVQNVYGVNARKKLVVNWGEKLGLDATDSLRIAQAANLFATSRKPTATVAEKLPRKTQEKTS
jgi:hypothetical protein